ncbi:hypothetical protein HOE37_03810 [Candidatus Woesearchaeota archaeon]|nr:hypothetical protein [Candidatus Woesearchaeota archaeon]MBT4110957.1 hypothetical protein [Candidatus Woesearchaeota archaeon]MBT4336531.1 hypothetical protein [Candidatus Woesearchaeota archaeon]MBT4469720.1 hypothetical protein [Candidatus Woesearchaeota archaeon]MBT6744082.1 hypothetical protein [Candidatus Woesearchaeota archaeon]
MIEKKDYGKWSLRCGIGSIVAPFLFLLLFIVLRVTRLMYSLGNLIIFGLLLGLLLGFLGIVLYSISSEKKKWALILSILGIILDVLLILNIFIKSAA